MNCLINLVVKKKSKNVKGLNWTVKNLKTQTNFEFNFEKKDRPVVDAFHDLTEDLSALGIADGLIGPVSFIVGNAGAIGRMHNRSIKALSSIGVITQEIDWDTDSGILEYTIEDGLASDLPALVETIVRLVFRSTVKCSHTRHPLTLFDLKQATSLVQDLKDGVAPAEEVTNWMNIRELTVKELEAEIVREKKKKERKIKAVKVAKEKKLAKKKAAAAATAQDQTSEIKDPNE